MLRRDHNLDALRGAAAISVCLYHICFADHFMPQNSLLEKLAQFGDKGVQVFFILSGLVIPWSISFRKYDLKLIKEFLIRRFIRIQIPYMMALIVTIFCYTLYIDPSLRISTKSIIYNFTYWVPYSSESWILNVAWTLGVEVQFYIILAFCFPFFSSNIFSIRILSLISLTSMSLIPVPEKIEAWYFFPTWSPFFAVGILIFLFKSEKISRREFYTLFSIIFCFLVIKYTKVLSLVCLSTTLFLLYFKSRKLSWLPIFLGRISYSLYLVHLPIILGIGLLLHRYNFSTEFPDISVLILLFCAISGSTIFYYLFESPVLKWVKKLKKI